MTIEKKLYKTAELVTETQLRDLYNDDTEEGPEDRIDTHDGAWIKEGSLWRWWHATE